MRVIKLSKSVVGDTEIFALERVIKESYLGMGKAVQDFESKLKEYLGAEYVVCVNSGTAALHLALMSAGLRPGDEVLVQSLTFVASLQAITAAGAVPVMCEIDPATCTIDLRDAQSKVSDRTRAVMPVHYAGRVGPLDEIYEFAGRYRLRVIEDAAHAFGTVYKNKRIGSFGDIVCFSFDGIKNITSGEGGAIVTNDKKAAMFSMDARLLGVQKDTEKRYSGLRSWEFDVTHQGYRYHMSNLFGAIGLVQLERFEKEFKPKRQWLAKNYYGALKDIPNIVLFSNDYDDVVPHIFPIRVKNGNRDGLREFLNSNGIECGIHYYPAHLLTYFGSKRGQLPVTEEIYGELLTIPLHPDIMGEDQQLIIDKIKEFFWVKT